MGNSLCSSSLSDKSTVMERNLCSLDLNTLKVLYDKEAAALSDALLNGASWNEVREQRKNVTELAIEIHKRRYISSQNPAEQSIRSEGK
jgi:hypothetical protein